MKREAGAEVMVSGRVSEPNKRIEEKKTSKVQEVTQCSVLAADNVGCETINPAENNIVLKNGRKIGYDHLVVAMGMPLMRLLLKYRHAGRRELH